MFRDTPESHHFVITDARDPEKQLTDDLQIHFVELCKDMHKDTPLTWWAELFEKSDVEGADMKILLSRGTTFAKAYEDCEYCKQNKQMRYEAMAREKFLMDQRSRLSYALKKGLAEGKAEGKAEVARLMIERGMDMNVIAEITGLAVEELESLLKEHPAD